MAFVGRPTKYDPAYRDKLVDFYHQPSTVKLIKTFTTKNGTVIEEPYDAPNKPVHVVDFCDEINISIGTFYNWLDPNHASHQPEFLEAYTHAKKYLERNIVDNALLNNYNGGFAALVAKNWFDWKDKSDVTSNDQPMSFSVVRGNGDAPPDS